jgi:hypothetical protein
MMPLQVARSITCRLVVAVAAGALLLAAAGCAGADHTTGTKAGGLDAGSVVGAKFKLKRGHSFMVGLITFANHGASDATIDEAVPVTSYPRLEATRARFWIIPRDEHLLLPNGWQGWPPKNFPGAATHPAIESLPEHGVTLPPGRTLQLLFGVKTSAQPGQTQTITDVRVKFHRAGKHYVWTIPEPVAVTTT